MQDVLQNQPGATNGAPDTIGSLLARVRAAHQLEQRDAAHAMGVSVGVVQALEENAFERLGAPVFVRGHLTRYARLLDLPEREILNRYKQSVGTEPPPLRVTASVQPQAKMTDTGVRWFSYLLVTAVLGWLGWLGLEQMSSHFEFSNGIPLLSEMETGDDVSLALPQQRSLAPAEDIEQYAKSPSQEERSTTVTSPPATISAVVTEPVDSVGNGSQAVTSRSVASTPLTETTSESAATSLQPSQSRTSGESATAANTIGTVTNVPEQTATSGATAEPAGSQEDSTLVLSFSADCWVAIKDAKGNQLAYGVMKANTARTLSGPAPFSLTLGNSPVVQIKLDDKLIDQAVYVPKRGTVSRFTLNAPVSGGGAGEQSASAVE